MPSITAYAELMMINDLDSRCMLVNGVQIMDSLWLSNQNKQIDDVDNDKAEPDART